MQQLIVGESSAVQHARQLVEQVAVTSANVLIMGEVGTGKELAARALHQMSPRRDGPLVPVNCGAIAADLLESELFGHQQGAFSGALSHRRGRFELADKGTLFLDNIGEMPLDIQAKVLRVIQGRSVERLGSDRPVPVDVRIVAATCGDLDVAVRAGRFREDLFYRLNVFPIVMPPLRERGWDIVLLTEHFARQLAYEGDQPIRLQPDAQGELLKRLWPGNCRELHNLVERLSILCPGQEISVDMLPKPPRQAVGAESSSDAEERSVVAMTKNLAASWPRQVSFEVATPSTLHAFDVDGGLDLQKHMEGVESSMIAQALEQSCGNVTRAADMLNIQPATLVEKIKKYRLESKP